MSNQEQLKEEIDKVLESVFNAGFEKAVEYRSSEGATTTTSDAMWKAKQALLAAFNNHVDREPEMRIGGKKVEFGHTAVNLDAHLFIDGDHDPELCPECIRPGTLVFTANLKGETR